MVSLLFWGPRRVIVESPLAASTPEDVERNKRYARWCMRDCLNRGEAPYASHLILPQALDDTIPAEHELGIKAGFAWGGLFTRHVYYVDLTSESALVARRITLAGSLWWAAANGLAIGSAATLAVLGYWHGVAPCVLAWTWLTLQVWRLSDLVLEQLSNGMARAAARWPGPVRRLPPDHMGAFLAGKEPVEPARDVMFPDNPACVALAAGGLTYHGTLTNLAAVREHRGLSYEQLAHAIDPNADEWGEWAEAIESEIDVQWPWVTWQGFARALGVSVADLLGAPESEFAENAFTGPLIAGPVERLWEPVEWTPEEWTRRPESMSDIVPYGGGHDGECICGDQYGSESGSVFLCRPDPDKPHTACGRHTCMCFGACDDDGGDNLCCECWATKETAAGRF